MKIKKILAKKVFIPLKEPFKYALSTINELEYVYVYISAGDYTGIGEASPAKDVTGETQNSVMKVIETMKPFLINKSIETKDDIKKIMEEIDLQIIGNQAAKSGIDMALFDLLGKIENLPIYKILSGKNIKSVKLQKTFGFFDENNLENNVKDSIKTANHLKAEIIKYKVGYNEKYDLSLIKLARRYNPKIKIILDVNQGWKNFGTADLIFKKIKKYNILWIEQPLPASDYNGSAMLRKKYKIPIIIDEGMKSLSDCQKIKSEKSADLVNIKISKVGGFLKAKEIIDFCEKNKIKYMLGDMVHSDVATAANLHLATLGNFVSYDIDNSRVKNENIRGLEKNGLVYEIPQSAGLGVSII